MDAQALNVDVRRDVADVATPAQQPWDISVHLSSTPHLDRQEVIDIALRWT